MDEIDILPHCKGGLCHDYWRAYFKYKDAKRLLYNIKDNAHHLRELLRAYEQLWAKEMHHFLTSLNNEVTAVGDMLSIERQQEFVEAYKAILAKADIECPAPELTLDESAKPKKGKLKRSKARNLLERLIKHPEDVLRFMTAPFTPFTNNQGERDIRMTKVHQKITGCFRSMKGAEMFCRIRSYISTCQKHGLSVVDALESLLMENTHPEFIQDILDQVTPPE